MTAHCTYANCQFRNQPHEHKSDLQKSKAAYDESPSAAIALLIERMARFVGILKSAMGTSEEIGRIVAINEKLKRLRQAHHQRLRWPKPDRKSRHSSSPIRATYPGVRLLPESIRRRWRPSAGNAIT